jgi:imidazolonepropionase-like amidohydrolase
MRPWGLAAFLLPALSSLAVAKPSAKPVAEPVLAITGATVYPSPTAAPIPDGVVLLQGAKVLAVGTAQQVAVPPGATLIDGKGLGLAAGFWNCHVHLNGPEWQDAATAPAAPMATAMQLMLNRYGFTTVVDAGSTPANTVALRKRVERGDVPGPRILTAGAPLFPKDGIPIYLTSTLSPEVLAQLNQPATPAEARADVAANLAAGADATKVFAGSWLGGGKTVEMAPDILRAAAEATHAAKKPVLAHPQTVEGVRRSLANGVDVLMHTTPGEAWPAELAPALVAAHMGLVPTLGLWTVVGRQANSPPAQVEDFVQRGVTQLRAFAKAGGQVLFGTDVGFLRETDTSEELVRMAQAGLSWRALLASLTTAPAARFPGYGTGTLAKGEPADVVLFRGLPIRDPLAYSRIVLTLRGGKVLYRAQEPVFTPAPPLKPAVTPLPKTK